MRQAILLLAILTLAGPSSLGAPEQTDDSRIDAVVRRLCKEAKLDVSIQPSIAARKTNVNLEGLAPLAALKKIAKDAGVHLVEIGKDAYWLGPRLEDWEKRVWRSLVGKRVDLDLEASPLSRALEALAKETEVAIVIDPNVLSSRTKDELEITLSAHGIRARDGIGVAAQSLGLAWDLRWGVVFVSTRERLAALPRHGMSPPPTGKRPRWETRMRKRLATERVTLAFAGTPLPMALKMLGMSKGIELKTEGEASTDSVDIAFEDLSLGQALDLLLVPRGYRYPPVSG